MKRLICIVLALVLSFSVCAPALAHTEKTAEVDADVAATIAILFVMANPEESAWDMTTNIDDIVPLYNNDEEIIAYCVGLKTDQGQAGYVIVSADLNKPLIQEYSDVAPSLIDITSNCMRDIPIRNRYIASERVYYYGPLSYSTSKQRISTPSDDALNDVNSQANYEQASNFIRRLKTTGLLTAGTRDYITNPRTYLEGLYPNSIITNIDYYNIGDNAIYGYTFYENNACSVYGVAAILRYYLSGYAFSTIVNRCKEIAEDNGYAAYRNNAWDYYIALGNLQPFFQLCINDFGLGKTATSVLLNSWTVGTSEISNNRPVLWNICYSGQYNDHTVTAFAWTRFSVDATSIEYHFIKVKDGYTTASRYVCHNTVTGDFITKVT